MWICVRLSSSALVDIYDGHDKKGWSLRGAGAAVTASMAKADLLSLIEQVIADRTAVEIVSNKGSGVLISLAKYEALQETAFLLRTPASAPPSSKASSNTGLVGRLNENWPSKNPWLSKTLRPRLGLHEQG
ncbi:type II toxin-antitoxin system Phd/YefM family antitoxin [Paenarthrobacter sp. NPDC018779]|uniref:type II toxin-antitoxin system Phd/YefM family antitoxin n=1 Tax=Paenarthrobacter sp. NPDC018779 TaxID=3364375 RepID=UPI0037CBB411